jgi:transposase-like protein
VTTAERRLPVFAGFRFPYDVISIAVRWRLRYGVSYRDVEELLAEPGVTVDHLTVYRWVQRFTPEFIEAARPCRHGPGVCACGEKSGLRPSVVCSFLESPT